MKLKLVSDFSELYDAFFDSYGFEHRRVTTDGINRIAMFNMMKLIGLNTPKFGYLSSFKGDVGKDYNIVIYDNINSHRGEGKRLCSLDTELEIVKVRKTWSNFCSLYIDTSTDTYKSKSTRILVIGNRAFTYDYISYDDWRSNCGDGEIINPKEIPLPEWRVNIHSPMFAIDFVKDLAIDFNISPGIQGTGVNKLISNSEIVLSLKNWYREYFGR